MNGFTLLLASATRRERIDDVTSFVGADASGAFGILARHARMITVLDFGLARYRVGSGDWQWLALPGAVLRFADNALSIAGRRYVHGADYARIRATLDEELRSEEHRLGALKDHLQRLEREIFRKLWQAQRP